MAGQPLDDFMETVMERMRGMTDGNIILGDPLSTPDGVTLIPVSRVSMGFVSGGVDKSAGEKPSVWGGGGGSVKIDPVGFLVIKDGGVKMLSIQPPAMNTVDRMLDLVPEVMDRVEGYVEKYTKKRSGKGRES